MLDAPALGQSWGSIRTSAQGHAERVAAGQWVGSSQGCPCESVKLVADLIWKSDFRRLPGEHDARTCT